MKGDSVTGSALIKPDCIESIDKSKIKPFHPAACHKRGCKTVNVFVRCIERPYELYFLMKIMGSLSHEMG